MAAQFDNIFNNSQEWVITSATYTGLKSTMLSSSKWCQLKDNTGIFYVCMFIIYYHDLRI